MSAPFRPGGPVPTRTPVVVTPDDGPFVRVVDGRPCIDSTDTARQLRLHPSDPLFRRYEALRASGRLRPVTLEPVPLFDYDEVARLARPWEPVDGLDDPLREARGIVVGVALGAVLIAVAVGLVWMVAR